MTAPGGKSGPLTQADIQAIWEGAVDSGFSQAMEAAGEGRGFEAYTQMFAQMARVSLAVDITTQAAYILASSGQSNPPASGPNPATVTLTLTRGAGLFVDRPLVLMAGTLVDEQTNDWGDDGAVPVLTGRRYALLQDAVFPPGDSGPITTTAQSEGPGYGYNNPQPNTLVVVDQVGSGYSNTGATVTLTPPGAPFGPTYPPGTQPANVVLTLYAANVPDMFLPQHVGQYVLMTLGANAGKVARVVGYLAPGATSVSAGSGVQLAYDQAIEVATSSPAPLVGEQVLLATAVLGTPIAWGRVVGVRPGTTGHNRVVFVLQAAANGVAAQFHATGLVLIDQASGAVATVTAVLDTPVWVAESGTAAWRVLDWANDLAAQATNPTSPTGGTSGMLDELGYERDIRRARLEADAGYRKRVAGISDTVSPDALRRALSRALGGATGCLRETMQGLPGFFYDRTDAGGDFYDMGSLLLTGAVTAGSLAVGDLVQWVDASGLLVAAGYWGGASGGFMTLSLRDGPLELQPLRLTFQAGDRVVGPNGTFTLASAARPTSAVASRWHLYLDYLSFRAYFLAGIPPTALGDFGFCFDAHPAIGVGGFWDQALSANFYDGIAVGQNAAGGQVWGDENRVCAGGVGFDVYIERIGCTS